MVITDNKNYYHKKYKQILAKFIKRGNIFHMIKKKKTKKAKETKYSDKLLEKKDLFGKRLRKCREENKLSHDKMSEAIWDKENISFSNKSLKTYEVVEKYHEDYEKALGMSFYRFLSLADFFNVSLDYMAGREQCKTPEKQEVFKLTGLYDKTQDILKNAVENKEKLPELAVKLHVINYLIQNMNNNDFLLNMHKFLFAEYGIPDENNKGYVFKAFPYVYSDGNYKGQSLLNADEISDIFYSKLQQDIAIMKEKFSNNSVVV